MRSTLAEANASAAHFLFQKQATEATAAVRAARLRLSGYNDEKLELVLFALEDLRKSLKEQGSNLMIRFGNAENVIKELVLEVEATNVFAEVEVEYHLREITGVVEKTLRRLPLFDRCPEIVLWQTPFYDVKNLKDLPVSYDKFEKLRLAVTSPLLPSRLPSAEIELDWGKFLCLKNGRELLVCRSIYNCDKVRGDDD
ncbi:unnamed protein product [Dovyalis caffra]|uniref:Photolyase/cryptochrome alpha/beta domain-containing protein n=1 Tax=Dovyalis caffra TaxID=77055 RepID=A0AAV1RKV2_9ROSI|nr:unnamed protein product [Dovyalis caffra]